MSNRRTLMSVDNSRVVDTSGRHPQEVNILCEEDTAFTPCENKMFIIRGA